MTLIRQHDYVRWWEKPIGALGKIADYGDETRTNWGCYVLNTVNDDYPAPPNFSRLVAKDAIPPYSSRGRVGGRHREPPEESECPEFVVKRSLSGDLEMMRPSERQIGPPVFFDPKVLKRYYDHPSLYSVGFHAPGLGGASGPTWSIPLGRNSEGVILAWLGDFLKKSLPLDEIRHWCAYNIEPRGGMADDFWQAQMQCRPPSQPSLESRLRDLRYHLKNAIESRGHTVFRSYEGPDRHAENGLREPLYDEHSEFHETIRLVTIVLVEYLDVQGMKASLANDRKKDANGKPLGSIVLFSNWLEDELGISREVASQLRSSLQRLQAVRSTIGGSHRFSDEAYEKALQKLQLAPGASAREIYRAVVEPIVENLEQVCLDLGHGDELWWRRKRSGDATS